MLTRQNVILIGGHLENLSCKWSQKSFHITWGLLSIRLSANRTGVGKGLIWDISINKRQLFCWCTESQDTFHPKWVWERSKGDKNDSEEQWHESTPCLAPLWMSIQSAWMCLEEPLKYGWQQRGSANTLHSWSVGKVSERWDDWKAPQRRSKQREKRRLRPERIKASCYFYTA